MKQALRGFLLSVSAGIVAGTIWPLLIAALVIAGWGSANIASGLGGLLMILIIPALFVVAAMIIVAIPLTLLLRMYGRESEAIYSWAGAIVGFAIVETIAVFLNAGTGDSFWTVQLLALPVAALGAFSGYATGRTWWREYRHGALDS